jgi:hypothetical protein
METRELRRPPATARLYARTVAPLLPGASLLPFVGGRGAEIPALELVLADVAVEPDRLAAYAHVCGFSLRETLPATYPHALAFPLQLALMTDPAFPFAAIGLVHLENRIQLRRPLDIAERIELRVHATPLQPHPRGRTFALVSQTRVAGELVWEAHSTMLRRGPGGSHDGPGETSGEPGERGGGSGETGAGEGVGEAGDVVIASGGVRARACAREGQPAGARWRLPGDLGRRYAAVSGDRNPIHMHTLSAKAFGFRRAIAHGMWTKARCLAALEGLLPDAYAVEARFRRPIELPATVAFAETRAGAGVDFAVSDAARGTPHLEGRVEPLAGEHIVNNTEGSES